MYNEQMGLQVIDLYVNKKMSTANIAKQLKIGNTTVNRKLSKAGVLKTVSQARTKYTFNHNYFEIIDSEDKAYFLGLMFADGNVAVNQTTHVIRLVSKDSDILYKFLECIDSNSKIYREFHNKFKKECFKVQLSSAKMYHDLCALGCVPKKSLILKFPNQIPNKLMNHFIRGYFDGDGSVTCAKINNTTWRRLVSSMAGTKDFMQGILKELKSTKKIYKRIKNYINPIYIICFSVEDSFNLYNYMYKDATIFLIRKKDIFDNYIKQRSSTTTISNPIII